MPTLTLNGQAHEVAAGTRLAQAIEDAGVEIGHRCGGFARCTTCRVVFAAGEPAEMTRAEYEKLHERDLLGTARLACQIVCDHDMAIAEVVMTKDNQGWSDTGPALAPEVTPDAATFPREQLAG